MGQHEQCEVATLRGRALRAQCVTLLTQVVTPELIELHRLPSGVQISTLMLGSVLRSTPAEHDAAALRVRWMVDHLGARVSPRTFHTHGEVTLITSRRRQGRNFILAPHDTAIAVAEANQQLRLSVPELMQIATWGTAWAQACTALRDTTARPWTNQTGALTRAWPELSERAREVASGLAPEWEGSAAALCEAAQALED